MITVPKQKIIELSLLIAVRWLLDSLFSPDDGERCGQNVSTSSDVGKRQVVPTVSGTSPVHLIEGVGNSFQDKWFCIVKVSLALEMFT